MFNPFKSKSPPPVSSNLYLINLHIGRGNNTEMPESLDGAYVPSFATAPDPESAARQVVSHLTGRGFEFLGIADNKIHQLDPSTWDSYLKSAWPEFVDALPSQEQVQAGLASGLLFFGPFAGDEPERA
jgi:hypothetical protein